MFRPGQKVTYVENGKREHGIVKRSTGKYSYVVYQCAGNWERYNEYTAVRTQIHTLVPGWI